MSVAAQMSELKSNHSQNVAIMLTACLLFSTSGVLIKLASNATSFQLAGLRSGVAALALFMLFRHSLSRITIPILLTAISYAFTLICFVTSTKLTAASTAIFLQSTAPAYILLLTIVLFRYRPSRDDFVLMCIFAAGTLLFFLGTPRKADSRLGDVIGVVTGIFQGITIFRLANLKVSDSSPTDGRDPILTSVILGNGLTFLLCLPFSLRIQPLHATDWEKIVFLGLVQIGFGYFLFCKAVKWLPALEVSLILLLEPVLNSLWVGLITGEWPRFSGFIGGAFVLFGCMLDINRRSQLRVRSSG